MNVISSTSGTDVNSARSENNHCLNSWTWWRRDERYDETSSSLCLISKSQKEACRMWLNHLLDMLSLIITTWMVACTRNGWMRNEPRRTFASTRMMMKGGYGYRLQMGRTKRKWNHWTWWWMRVVSSMKWQRSTSWMECVIIPVFHHYHGIQPHVDTGWGIQDTQSHR